MSLTRRALVLGALVASGCVLVPAPVMPPGPPPAAAGEGVPARPDPAYVWVPGHWTWRRGAYTWIPGTWLVPPRPGYVWAPGHWVGREQGHVWVDGYWYPR